MTPLWVPLSIAVLLALLGVLFAAALARDVMRRPTSVAMAAVSRAIREAAIAFLHRQYRAIGIFVVVMASLLGVLYGIVERDAQLGLFTAVSFVVGGACSGASGYLGVHVAIRANVRAARAAQSSLDDALRVALRGGAVNAIVVVALALLGIAVLFVAGGGLGDGAREAPFLLAGYALGASSVALFSQLGGGIYTKAADMGADLVGKIESRLSEDDPRNPVAIADLVGDNVGDCAGRGADLFESTAAEIVGTMILAVALFSYFGAAGIVFPLIAGGFGIIASIVGLLAVRTGKRGDAMAALNRGFYVTAALVVIGLVALARWLLYAPSAPSAWWHFALCGAVGVATSIALALLTQYYTSARFRPLRFVIEESASGPATNLLAGFSTALVGTLATAAIIALAIVAASQLGAASGLVRGSVYGTAVATTGMLAMATYVLAMDMFGPIIDNAGGIAQMSKLGPEVRERTDRLDACGNTTKAITKSYALGSAALAAFLLLSAYLDTAWTALAAKHPGESAELWTRVHTIDFAKPEVFVSGLLGAMLVFHFSGLAIKAVARAAHAVIVDVRRQLLDKPGILDGSARPDYGRSVDIVTRVALRQMIRPALAAIGIPIAVGLVFRMLGEGIEAVAGFLLVTTLVGVLFANVLNSSGAIWDNAKKAVERHAPSSSESDRYRATVLGDTVGDSFKDTAGPSLHVLIKLVAAVALVFAPFFA